MAFIAANYSERNVDKESYYLNYYRFQKNWPLAGMPISFNVNNIFKGPLEHYIVE